jgi:hypothetical protein
VPPRTLVFEDGRKRAMFEAGDDCIDRPPRAGSLFEFLNEVAGKPSLSRHVSCRSTGRPIRRVGFFPADQAGGLPGLPVGIPRAWRMVRLAKSTSNVSTPTDAPAGRRASQRCS